MVILSVNTINNIICGPV